MTGKPAAAGPAQAAVAAGGDVAAAAGGDVAAEAWRLLRGVVLDHDRRREACRAVGLSFSRVVALLTLADRACSMSELATALATDAPYATVVVGDLERRGLVTRRVNPADRRGRQAALTTRGRRAAERARAILETPPEWIRALDPSTLSLIIDALRPVPQRNR